jgi:serine/threonine-protein kinase
VTAPPDHLTAALADRYRLERELGQGGMATVYLAHDLKHDRQVAIKVLRPELAAIIGAERFLAEIKTTANLQHPHILPLFDSGSTRHSDPERREGEESGRSPTSHSERSEESGRIGSEFLYYVMPYVEGETLRDRLTREKQLPLPDAIRLATEIAGALDYAHRHGVIHRDIKPENILLHDGRALVADFGIALAASRAGGARLTETGMSLGTPAYMSPEQAMGERDITARSDVYALGCVTYEMLVGEPPFTGPTAQAVVAKVMTAPAPSPAASRAKVPPGVEAAVLTALEKLPADRFATAAEFASALTTEGRHAATAEPARPRRTLPLLAVGAGAAAIALALVAWRAATREAPVPTLGRSTQLTSDPALEIQPAISPDGKFVAYSAGRSASMRIYIRPVGGGRTIPLTDDSTAVETQARWSPDGENLLFLTGGGVSVAPALGGNARRVVAPGAGVVWSAAWSPTGSEIAFVRGDSLQVVPLSGAPARLLATLPEAHSCDWSPDGRWIACAQFNNVVTQPGVNFGNLAPGTIVLVPAAGGAPVELFQRVASYASPFWAPKGRRLYFVSNRDGPRDVYALSLDASGKARGQPERVTTGLGATSASLSGDGRRLAYATYAARANLWSVPIPASGSVSAESATPLTSSSQVIESMRVSPDGRWLLYDSNLEGNSDIYRMPIGGGASERLTSNPVDEFAPDLSPDGRTIAYHTWRTGTRDIEIAPLDGAPAQLVTDSPQQESYPAWSPDGRSLVYLDQTPMANAAYLLRRDADGRWAPAVQLADSALSPAWSPDGASVAYIVGATARGANELRVLPATGGQERSVFAKAAGLPAPQSVRWSPDGGRLYFKSHDAAGRTSLWSVSSAGGMPRLLVEFPNPERQSSRYDFAVDATRFYFTIEDRQSDIAVAELLPR